MPIRHYKMQLFLIVTFIFILGDYTTPPQPAGKDSISCMAHCHVQYLNAGIHHPLTGLAVITLTT